MPSPAGLLRPAPLLAAPAIAPSCHSPSLSPSRHHAALTTSVSFPSAALSIYFGAKRTAKTMPTICMANPRRMQMVAKQIQREIADMLIKDKVLQHAIMPETALGADEFLSSVTTVSEVEVSRDLQVAKVYISVFGDERGKEVAIAGLQAKSKYVRGQLGKRMRLRFTPEVRFLEDDSLEETSRVISIIEKLKKEREAKAKAKKGNSSSQSSSEDDQDDYDSDEDDEDEDEDDDQDDPDWDGDEEDEDEDEDEDDDQDDEDDGIIYVD